MNSVEIAIKMRRNISGYSLTPTPILMTPETGSCGRITVLSKADQWMQVSERTEGPDYSAALKSDKKQAVPNWHIV